MFNLFLKYNCFITLRRIIVEKIEWLDIKETLVLHLLNLAIGGADYLPFASLLVVVKSARLGESPSTQVASVRSFPRVSSAMSPEGGNIGETPSATSTSVRLLPGVSPQVGLQVGGLCVHLSHCLINIELEELCNT